MNTKLNIAAIVTTISAFCWMDFGLWVYTHHWDIHSFWVWQYFIVLFLLVFVVLVVSTIIEVEQ